MEVTTRFRGRPKATEPELYSTGDLAVSPSRRAAIDAVHVPMPPATPIGRHNMGASTPLGLRDISSTATGPLAYFFGSPRRIYDDDDEVCLCPLNQLVRQTNGYAFCVVP
ncbi:hypothetical protein ZWY2020_040663 [Hordeum vulgare]|nr:hypothetical protein ZWY2020_040663 [Hordeum vulgare]